MLLRDILLIKGSDIQTIASQASCDDAVAKLVCFRIGSLLVRDAPDAPVLGIITERDILRAQAEHQAVLEELKVATVMSHELVVADPDDSLVTAMRLMTNRRVRHLPVIRDAELYGIVSIGDLVKAHHDALEMENYYMRSYIRGEGGEVATPP